MMHYIPKSNCPQLTFVDFLRNRHQFIPPTTQIISIFSAYKQPGHFDVSILYKKRGYYIENFDFSSLPSDKVELAILVPFDCPTKNLPYDSEKLLEGDAESLEIYKDFWHDHALTNYFSNPYFYDPKRMLGFEEEWSFYGQLDMFEIFFKHLLHIYKKIIISSSFWDLYGFGYVTRQFRNNRFIKKYPILHQLFEKNTIYFTDHSVQDRIGKIHGYITYLQEEKNKKPLPKISLSGVIDWVNDFETLRHYTNLGGKFCWQGCKDQTIDGNDACDPSCPPSVITLCPNTFIKILNDHKAMKILT